ncbi:hypothetical protein ACFE04_016247 [Oxalis oulophora]
MARAQLWQLKVWNLDLNAGLFFTKIVEKLKLKIPGLKHVCKIDRYLKTTLCERLLEIDSHGFILRPSRGSDLDCAETELYIKLPTLKTSEFTKLLMYSCPTVSYIDLETGEQTIFTLYLQNIYCKKCRCCIAVGP